MTARPRYLRHLTLDTGDQRDSYRTEVADDVLAMLRPLIDRAVAGETVALPAGDPPCTITAAAGRDRALLVTVWGPPDGAQRVPLVTLGVAPSSRASAELWREWIGRERDDRTPAPPWCVAKLQPGLLVYTRAADWLGDLERCIAWAWIDQ